MFSDFKVNQNLRHIGGLGRLILRNDRFWLLFRVRVHYGADFTCG